MAFFLNNKSKDYYVKELIQYRAILQEFLYDV